MAGMRRGHQARGAGVRQGALGERGRRPAREEPLGRRSVHPAGGLYPYASLESVAALWLSAENQHPPTIARHNGLRMVDCEAHHHHFQNLSEIHSSFGNT